MVWPGKVEFFSGKSDRPIRARVRLSARVIFMGGAKGLFQFWLCYDCTVVGINVCFPILFFECVVLFISSKILFESSFQLL